MPFLRAFKTRAASGWSSFSDGPTAPAAPAASRVWQIAQAGVAPFKNKSLPASSFAEASGVKAEADTSTTAAMALAKRVEIIFCI